MNNGGILQTWLAAFGLGQPATQPAGTATAGQNRPGGTPGPGLGGTGGMTLLPSIVDPTILGLIGGTQAKKTAGAPTIGMPGSPFALGGIGR
jgi:hypothetical protein